MFELLNSKEKSEQKIQFLSSTFKYTDDSHLNSHEQVRNPGRCSILFCFVLYRFFFLIEIEVLGAAIRVFFDAHFSFFTFSDYVGYRFFLYPLPFIGVHAVVSDLTFFWAPRNRNPRVPVHSHVTQMLIFDLNYCR